ncbi:MAG: hypothetical protein IKM39_02215 [Clostridia bacterium]|nr:hypothetical protein [Clostridia bacterium]
MPSLTKQELLILKQSILQEKSLIKAFETAAEQTNDPILRGKWQEAAATHQTHYRKLQTFFE